MIRAVAFPAAAEAMDSLRQDLRHGLRVLRSRPGFTAVAALVLALGVGASTTVFSAVDALLLRPLPVADVDRLVFGMALREGFDPFGTSLLEYDLYARQATSLASCGVGAPRLFTLAGSGEPERLRGAAVTPSYLRTLGVEPVLGRLFTTDDDRPGGPAVALLGNGLWRRRFGAEREVIGRVLSLEDGPRVVVGVLPSGFDLPYSAEAWVPMQVAAASLPLDQRAATAHEFVARLAPGASLEQADTELKGLARRLEQDHPRIRRGWSFGLVPLRRQLMSDLEGRTQRSLRALVVAVAGLLLVCCANVASLLLARGVSRRGEMAVRISLGAGPARLVRQLLVESLVLALLGGGIGWGLALAARPLLGALSPIQAAGLGSHLTDFRLDGPVLLFSLAASLSTGALFGTVAALRAVRSDDLVSALKARSRQSGGAGAGRRPLRMLVVGEIAVAATLLVGGALTTRSFLRLQEIDLGFRPAGLVTMELPLSPVRYERQDARVRLVEEVLARVRALPGVEGAGTTTNVPLQRGVLLDAVFEVEGRPPADPGEVPITSHRLASPGYLETLGVTLERGRLLDERDRGGSPLVAVVSRELARKAWPGQDPLGRRIRRVRAGQPGPWMAVVGVVKDVREDRFGYRAPRPVWYLPYAQQTVPLPVSLPLNLVVRTGGGTAAVGAAVREAIRAVDPAQPVAGLAPMSEHLSDVLRGERFGAVLMGTMGALGLALAALGLYGVMAYSVSQRGHEIGLRMALGARPRDVVGLVLVEGGTLVVVGLALGLAGAFALGRLLASTLHDVDPADPHAFLLVALVLGAAGLAASWLPARRAARVDPMTALRSE
jgi:putative ABC transport system permease protein